MKPPHNHFFSSLKQVEKRLKLDNENPPQPQQTQSTDSSTGSPIYFHTNTNTNTNTSSSTLNNNSIPHEFLSIPTHSLPNPNNPQNIFPDTVADINSMLDLLRLSDVICKGPHMPDVADHEFYDNIVKVKGPKCKKEVERLDAWITYLLSNGDMEPFTLAHLLLAKAALVSDCHVFDFPSTVDDFLHNDPPFH